MASHYVTSCAWAISGSHCWETFTRITLETFSQHVFLVCRERERSHFTDFRAAAVRALWRLFIFTLLCFCQCGACVISFFCWLFCLCSSFPVGKDKIKNFAWYGVIREIPQVYPPAPWTRNANRVGQSFQNLFHSAALKILIHSVALFTPVCHSAILFECFKKIKVSKQSTRANITRATTPAKAFHLTTAFLSISRAETERRNSGKKILCKKSMTQFTVPLFLRSELNIT